MVQRPGRYVRARAVPPKQAVQPGTVRIQHFPGAAEHAAAQRRPLRHRRRDAVSDRNDAGGALLRRTAGSLRGRREDPRHGLRADQPAADQRTRPRFPVSAPGSAAGRLPSRQERSDTGQHETIQHVPHADRSVVEDDQRRESSQNIDLLRSRRPGDLHNAIAGQADGAECRRAGRSPDGQTAAGKAAQQRRAPYESGGRPRRFPRQARCRCIAQRAGPSVGNVRRGISRRHRTDALHP